MTAIPSDILQQNLETIGGLKRRTVRTQSDVSNYSAGQKIIINLPSQSNSCADLRRSYFSMVAQLTQNGGTYAGFSYPISTLFSRLRILVGSQVVTDIDSIDALMGMFAVATATQSVLGNTGSGTYTQATRRTESLTARLYEFKFDIDFLERIYPVDRIRGGVRIELTVNQANICCEYDGGTPTIAISQFYLNYYSIEMTSEISQMVDGLIATGQYIIKGWNWNSFTGQTANQSGSQIQLPFKFKCIRGFLWGYRDNADITDPLVNLKYTDNWQEDGIATANLKIGVEQFPVEGYQFNTGLQGYLLTQRDFNSFMNQWFQSHSRQMDFFGASAPLLRFMTAFDVRMDSTSNAWGNGINTADGNTNQIINVTYAAPPGALWHNVFAAYETTVLVGANGNVVVSF